MNTPFSLSGKTILVTGASSGIGRATAIACSQMGAAVVITGRDKGRLAAAKAELAGGGHHLIAADLTKEEERERLASGSPALDGVVHCAGIGFLKPCKMIKTTDIDKVIGTNFSAPVLLQSLLLSGKKINKSASIVFISSIAVKSPASGNALYSASKGAINAYAGVLALELAPRSVRVNCICPAVVWTEAIERGPLSKEEHELRWQDYLLKRYGTPQDIANMVVYLLSDASLWVTGSVFDITGGGEQ